MTRNTNNNTNKTFKALETLEGRRMMSVSPGIHNVAGSFNVSDLTTGGLTVNKTINGAHGVSGRYVAASNDYTPDGRNINVRWDTASYDAHILLGKKIQLATFSLTSLKITEVAASDGNI